jgi:hypothetical protein
MTWSNLTKPLVYIPMWHHCCCLCWCWSHVCISQKNVEYCGVKVEWKQILRTNWKEQLSEVAVDETLENENTSTVRWKLVAYREFIFIFSLPRIFSYFLALITSNCSSSSDLFAQIRKYQQWNKFTLEREMR